MPLVQKNLVKNLVENLHCCTKVPIMHKLHVKIDNQAFMFIHVLEQVQPFKQGYSDLFSLRVRNREGGEVVPMKRTILTRLVNSEVPRIKKNVKNSRLEVMEKSGVLCVNVCDRPPCAISVSSQFFGWMHMQSSESDYTQQNRENTHREM